MRNIKIIFGVMMYLSLISILAIFVGEAYFELILNLPRNHELLEFSGLFIPIFLFSYFILIWLCCREINWNENWDKKEKLFWKKIIISKPISGITAVCFITIRKRVIKVKPILIKILFNSRMIFFVVSLILLLILFVLEKPMKIYLYFIVLFFFCISSTIMTDIIYETLILMHASGKEKQEWEDFDYYKYFTSLRSIVSPFRYSAYYRKQIYGEHRRRKR